MKVSLCGFFIGSLRISWCLIVFQLLLAPQLRNFMFSPCPSICLWNHQVVCDSLFPAPWCSCCECLSAWRVVGISAHSVVWASSAEATVVTRGSQCVMDTLGEQTLVGREAVYKQKHDWAVEERNQFANQMLRFESTPVKTRGEKPDSAWPKVGPDWPKPTNTCKAVGGASVQNPKRSVSNCQPWNLKHMDKRRKKLLTGYLIRNPSEDGSLWAQVWNWGMG